MRNPIVLACCLGVGLVHAQSGDLDALALADQTPEIGQGLKSGVHAFAELARGRQHDRDGLASHDETRLSLDVRVDKDLTDRWRLSFADRLDVNWRPESPRQDSVNTLKEAYLSWRSEGEHSVDVGRVNVFNGVSLAYNPTDFFRAGSLRSVISRDPKQLTQDRQGTVMARGQWFGDGHALTAIYAPRLAGHAANTPFSLNAGATNPVNRGLLSYSVKVSDGFNPQFLLYKEDDARLQYGFNATALANDATVLFAQWVGGKSRGFFQQALGLPGRERFNDRASVGATCTTALKLSVTAEMDFSRGSLGEADWADLGQRDPQKYWLYRSWVLARQEMATRRALTLHASWRDALVNRLDLTVLSRVNLDDRSHFSWLEVRYHWDEVDMALQWQMNRGRPRTEYGALPQSRFTALSLRSYF